MPVPARGAPYKAAAQQRPSFPCQIKFTHLYVRNYKSSICLPIVDPAAKYGSVCLFLLINIRGILFDFYRKQNMSFVGVFGRAVQKSH